MGRRDTRNGYYSTPAWKRLRLEVCRRDGYLCGYCGNKGYQADHILARSLGGSDTLENLTCACQWCNAVAGGEWFADFDDKKRWLRERRREREHMASYSLSYRQVRSLTLGLGYPLCAERSEQRIAASLARQKAIGDKREPGRKPYYQTPKDGHYHGSRAQAQARIRRQFRKKR